MCRLRIGSLIQNVVSVFIHADLDARIRRIARLYDLTDAKAKDTIVKADKKRASYYNYYSNKKWSDSAESYHMSLDSSVLGIDGTAEAIEKLCRTERTRFSNKKLVNSRSEFGIDRTTTDWIER